MAMTSVTGCGRAVRALAETSLAVLVAGCSALLPDTVSQTQAGWESFDDARRTIERIVPYQSRKADLVAMGLDPYRNPSITILTYSDILQRFAGGSAVRPEDLDRGIRECLASSKNCTGYAIAVRRADRKRVGNFWLDSLGFRRETEITGWSFNAVVILVDDLAVHTLFGGQPQIYEREVTRNPLGPLQNWGDQVPSIVR